ncbi:MAG TPA: Gfo/Idh/MocA family oxidoreductase [Bryobacteraceae bacterium]|nr:Gfo/Idh/MocA family oxidoreductase [Bryobacteraceae bacterium]
MTEHKFSRRGLLAGAAPLFVPASVFGRNAPSNRVNVGMIGVGRQAVIVNLKQFLEMPEVQVAAFCDVDSWRLEQAHKKVPAAKTYRDFRELLADKSIDAVMISTPDHWHVPMSIAAVNAGKDVSCEKPLTRSIAEGRTLADLVKKKKRVFRTDSEYRTKPHYHQAREAVLNGRIGRLTTIRTGVPKGDIGCPMPPDMPVPADLDYERWQGPAPRAPYTEIRVHKPQSYDRPGWMRHLYYCDGMVTNWGTHLNDLAQSGNGTDRTGPVEVEGRGTYPGTDSFWNVLLDFEIQYRYASGVRLIYRIDQPSIRFEGSEGWIYADDKGKIEASKPSILEPPSGSNWVRLVRKTDKQDFIDAVRSRGETMADAEVGHRTTSLCHLGHIAIHTGRRLEWDPAKEVFTNDKTANDYITKPIHAPGRG